ncbi:hypothetical protein ACQPYK_25260 [Streptosporangium sp. CA-135522]|uniref:hypothetical protein n=1 Tax=Streptosporangium sp. CA-135522 TaxID=3240072 RepID=UPI003D8DCAFB
MKVVISVLVGVLIATAAAVIVWALAHTSDARRTRAELDLVRADLNRHRGFVDDLHDLALHNKSIDYFAATVAEHVRVFRA